MQEKVAVILPVYSKDKEEYIYESLNSMLNQTYGNFKIYVGVDGPVGVDLKKCLEAFDKQDKISVVWFTENRGLACVLNDLLDICFKEGYEYIARMDADDISLPFRIEKQMSYLANNEDVDVVGGAVTIINEDGLEQGKVLSYPLTHDECYKRFAKRNPLPHPAVLFKKRYFDKAGCKYRPDYKKNQDTLLWYDGLLKGVRMGNVQEVILKFRTTDDMIKKRRSGKDAAQKQLRARLMINKGLHYGFLSDIYAYAIYLLMVSPSWLRSFIYKIQ